MKKPNFFIIGAPKCGTTSLASWLSEHPQIFISNPKEPWYFNTDVVFKRTESLSEYEAIFKKAQPHHVAVGEASTPYLWSREAVPSILAYSPDSQFIAILRKPQEMAVSLHAMECGGVEDVRDFETAWRLQAERARGRHLPKRHQFPNQFQYGDRCRVGSQLSRVLNHVPRERVQVLFLEDVRRNPRREYDKILTFLGVAPYCLSEFRVLNSRRHVRSFLFERSLNVLGYAKYKMGLKGATGILAPIYRLNSRISGSPKRISGQMQAELDIYFREEIATVRELVGRVPEEWHD